MPKGVRGVMPVVVVPLLATLITGLLMFLVIGKPIAVAAWTSLTDWLNGLTGANAILLGVLLGLMMGFDLGGPINKVAYMFAATGLADRADSPTDATQLQIMAAVMAAGMVPPLAWRWPRPAQAAVHRSRSSENGKAAWLLGASFITEGAIPFAAADPLRSSRPRMVGSAITGALVMAFGNDLRAPHGGIWVVPLISNPLL